MMFFMGGVFMGGVGSAFAVEGGSAKPSAEPSAKPMGGDVQVLSLPYPYSGACDKRPNLLKYADHEKLIHETSPCVTHLECVSMGRKGVNFRVQGERQSFCGHNIRPNACASQGKILNVSGDGCVWPSQCGDGAFRNSAGTQCVTTCPEGRGVSLGEGPDRRCITVSHPIYRKYSVEFRQAFCRGLGRLYDMKRLMSQGRCVSDAQMCSGDKVQGLGSLRHVCVARASCLSGGEGRFIRDKVCHPPTAQFCLEHGNRGVDMSLGVCVAGDEHCVAGVSRPVGGMCVASCASSSPYVYGLGTESDKSKCVSMEQCVAQGGLTASVGQEKICATGCGVLSGVGPFFVDRRAQRCITEQACVEQKGIARTFPKRKNQRRLRVCSPAAEVSVSYGTSNAKQAVEALRGEGGGDVSTNTGAQYGALARLRKELAKAKSYDDLYLNPRATSNWQVAHAVRARYEYANQPSLDQVGAAFAYTRRGTGGGDGHNLGAGAQIRYITTYRFDKTHPEFVHANLGTIRTVSKDSSYKGTISAEEMGVMSLINGARTPSTLVNL
ncbi:MAG: hypothetical protein GDA54_00740 [Alphaproteobacteria bacterium GM7ARS4]|nr:hypothetical protein [Alphaproteobacteria bacterium GM7ARS4]